MKREIILTADGSKTIYLPEWNEHYHSKHGAIQEAQHVFIKSGLFHIFSKNFPSHISIMEMGFGTGLNAYLTLAAIENLDLKVHYTGLEAFPVSADELKALNYCEMPSEKELFNSLHKSSWEEDCEITSKFCLHKQQKKFSEVNDKELFHLIYFDAFGVRVQPELWTESIFQKMFDALMPSGALVTYAAAGSVRRAMQAVGFNVERLPGPPGKREMLRAFKSS